MNNKPTVPPPARPRAANGLVLAAAGLAAVVLAGCGRPPAGAGGPPEDFAVNAVVAQANPENVKEIIQVVGSLKARDAVDLVSEINATVAEVRFADGQAVKAGDTLVKLDDTRLTARRDEAKARFLLAETNYRRSQSLFNNQTISKQEMDQAQAEFDAAHASLRVLERDLKDTLIKAPFDGVVSEKRVSVGQFLTVGAPVTRLIRMDPLELEFRVPEREAARLIPGSRVVMQTVSRPGAPVEGVVFFVDPQVEEQSRTVLTKALVENTDDSLKPGMYGTVDVVIEERPDALVIPEASVRYAGDDASVVVMNAEGRAEFRPVTIGQRFPGRVEIASGLQPGERVVVEGYQKMGPGTRIMISAKSEQYGVNPEPVATP